jgi:hypothetical protein
MWSFGGIVAFDGTGIARLPLVRSLNCLAGTVVSNVVGRSRLGISSCGMANKPRRMPLEVSPKTAMIAA